VAEKVIPASLVDLVSQALREAGDPTPLAAAGPVQGGYSSQARRLVTGRRSYFLKWSDRLPTAAYSREAGGLELLARVSGARVPVVLAAADPVDARPGFLLQEWVEARPADAYWQLGAAYGERIARMHRRSTDGAVPGYGLDHDNHVGKSTQRNDWQSDWVRFFRDQRLRPQVELGGRLGLLPPDLLRDLERLLARLEEWLGQVERQPVLLHGDLWRGNVLFDPAGEPVLIDPAVCWGDREFDLATVQIYEPAPPGFYEAYGSVWPLAAGFSERCDLHNLYLNLCCLTEDHNLSFIARIEATLRRYLG
jgi:fructosamine-3-kinase